MLFHKKNLIYSALLFFVFAANVFSQGSLTPDAAPAASMKTLEQVESRIPITNVPYTISSSGSYYLTRNFIVPTSDNGIDVEAHNVTIDLNGYTLEGGGLSSGTGIYISFRDNVSIKNGVLYNWRGSSQYAIYYSSSARGGSVQNVKVYECSQGIRLNSGIAKDCVVSDCTMSESTGHGIFVSDGVVSDCVVYNVTNSGGTSASGIYSSGSKVNNCTVRGIYADGTFAIGIMANDGGIVEGCIARDADYGIETFDGGVARNNSCYKNRKAGIYAADRGGRVEGNHVTKNEYGIYQTLGIYSNNLIIANSAINNTDNYYVVNAVMGPVDSGQVPTNHPWANFSH